MLQIIFAILAGALTVAAPCILPLLPIILGTSIGQSSKSRPVFIVAGFIITFSLAAIFISLLAKNIGLNPELIRNIGAAILGVFGVLMLWPKPFELLMLKFNNFFAKLGTFGDPLSQGKLSGFILGMTLGVVWTPCAGPVLGSILTLIALQKELYVAGILICAYAFGAALPMLALAYGGQYLASRIVAIAHYARVLQIIFGIIIIALALVIYLNYDIKIYAILLEHFPSFNPKL